MCGRAALTASPEDLRDAFGLDEAPELPPRYNIHPSQLLPVIRTPGKLELLRWGLVPAWAKDTNIGHKLALARFETIASKPAFREAARCRRCLVVVSGFYEWRRAGTKASAPFFFRRPDEKPFALAGVWGRWVSRDGELVESCAIVTQPAREPVAAVHDRMPIVLDSESWSEWLDPKITEASALLGHQPHETAELIALAVGSHVNDPRHDDPECQKAAGAPRQGVLWG
jgi:putative SOS response-associated peptidase YedK